MRPRLLPVWVLLLALVSAACGNRLTTEEILAQNRVVTGAGAGALAADPLSVAGPGPGPGGGSVTGEPGPAGVPAGPGADGGGGDAGPGGGGDALPVGAGDGGSAAPAAGAAPGTPQGADGDAPAPGARPDGEGAAPAAPVAGGKPVVIATVGVFSGIGGYLNTPARDALGAWVRSVNARGGIGGRPVELLVGDDGGNESKSLSLVRDFVEGKGAIAVVGYTGGVANAVGNYATKNKLPLVGGQPRDRIWFESPYLFPAGGGTAAQYYGAAQRLARVGKKKVGSIYCNESTACSSANASLVQYAEDLGLEVVYQGRVSLAQPDFTSECIQARNSGAEAVVPIGDSNTTVRFMQACTRQGYRPQLVIPLGDDNMTKVPELDGAIASLSHVGWFLYEGSPALAEYGAAVRTYAPELVGNSTAFASSGWVAGKLLERALQGVEGQPTRADVAEGLWRLRGETLGGLTQPLTFTKGKGTPDRLCTFSARLSGGRWSDPDRGKPLCAP